MNDNKSSPSCQTVVQFDVYAIWCRVTNQYYVGVTKGKVSRRIGQHKRGNQFVDQEIQRIGWENFEWWVVESGVPSTLITEREQYWVGVFNSVYPNGFNKTRGGISNITMSDDTREILRQKALERDMSGENNPHYGKKHTAEVNAANSARMRGENNPMYGKSPTNKGVPRTDEQKARTSAAMQSENNPFYGKHHTEQSNESNRQKHLNKPLSEEHKAKLRGKKRSEETKAVMRAKGLAREAAKRAAKAAEVAEVAKAAAEAAKGTDAAEALQAAADAAVAKAAEAAAEAQSKTEAAKAVVEAIEAAKRAAKSST